MRVQALITGVEYLLLASVADVACGCSSHAARCEHYIPELAQAWFSIIISIIISEYSIHYD